MFLSNKKRLFLLLAFLIIGLIVNAAFAVRVESLYQGQVSVASQSQEEQNHAIQAALLQVLTKVSGNNLIANNAEIKSHLNDAAKWVLQVGYPQPHLLSVNFDPSGINELLRQVNLPIWGQNRPLIVAWIEFESPGHPAEIISSDSVNEVMTLLKYSAEQHGLPMLFPLMDITDINQVTVNDIRTMAIPTLTNAAKRYAGDIILIGKIIQEKNNFTTQWRLVLNNNQWDWNLSGQTLNQVFSILMDNTMSTLASRFSVVTSNTVQSELILTVTGVTQKTDFAQLINYLDHLTPVANVDVKQISGSVVTLTISLRGTQQSFTQLLSLGKKLTPINAAEWTYQWNH
jgi:hypothetical protein